MDRRGCLWNTEGRWYPPGRY